MARPLKRFALELGLPRKPAIYTHLANFKECWRFWNEMMNRVVVRRFLLPLFLVLAHFSLLAQSDSDPRLVEGGNSDSTKKSRPIGPSSDKTAKKQYLWSTCSHT